jgi:hypothetical protein
MIRSISIKVIFDSDFAADFLFKNILNRLLNPQEIFVSLNFLHAIN